MTIRRPFPTYTGRGVALIVEGGHVLFVVRGTSQSLYDRYKDFWDAGCDVIVVLEDLTRKEADMTERAMSKVFTLDHTLLLTNYGSKRERETKP